MQYDLVVIGAGWAGFNAALKAKSHGLNTAVIDKGPIGGTCLNSGCIPTKSLVQSAKILSLARKSAGFGIDSESPVLNFQKIQERKLNIIHQLQRSMQFALVLKGVAFINSKARLLSPDTIELADQEIKAKNIIIASGSRPAELPVLKFDNQNILSSNDILNLQAVPKSILIVGGGVIGCEFACIFHTFGTQVTILEKLPQILPSEDPEVARRLETSFKKKGIKVITSGELNALDLAAFDKVLVCVGRVPDTQDLGIDRIGVKTERGRIVVDEYLRSSAPSIYAAGDCTGKIMLAHFAAYQGELAAFNIACPKELKKATYSNIPNCIFTEPEVASVGLTPESANANGINIEIHKFDFLGSGMARIMDETDGFVKIISNKANGLVVGGSIIGARATELIGIITLAIQSGLNIEALKNTVFAHPTLSEAISDSLK
jgi:dihydrolipoamide dehydrogenase